MPKEKPLKDVFKEPEDVSKYFNKVKDLPESTRRQGTGLYFKIVDAISKQPKGTYEIKVDLMNLPTKSIYPSIEKVIMQIAKRNNVDFSKTDKRKVGEREYTSYPEFDKFKKTVMRIRTRKTEGSKESKLYIEKLTDKAL